MPDYGALSKRALDEMIAGARVEVAPYKRNATDFVLWKPSKSGEPAWESPAGITAPGRPGWHIECSAMAWRHLGEIIDIHGGGIDLVFPHHENEIAQSRCAFHTPMLARFWMHNGFLQVEGEKMAKSAGNFITIRELLADWPGEVLRLNMLKTHYRQPMDWTLAGLEESSKNLKEWLEIAVPMRIKGVPPDQIHPRPLFPPLGDALCDDLNTPKAIAEIHGLRHQACHDHGDTSIVALSDSLRLLGLLHDDVTVALDRLKPRRTVDEGRIVTLVRARAEARRLKDFAEADRIRNELASMGVVLKDSKDETTWELAR